MWGDNKDAFHNLTFDYVQFAFDRKGSFNYIYMHIIKATFRMAL